MRRFTVRTVLVSIVVPLALLTGCAGTTDRGSLGDAVEKSKDGYKDKRQVEDCRESDTSGSPCLSSCLFGFSSSSDDTPPCQSGTPDPERYPPPPQYQDSTRADSTRALNKDPMCYRTAPPEPKSPLFTISTPTFWGVRAVTSNRFSRNYTHSAGGAILWMNRYAPRRAFEVSLQGEGITTGEKSPIFGALDNLGVISLGLHGRRFSTPDFTVMGLYLKYGIDISEMFWKYHKPLTSDVLDENGNLLRTDVIRFDALTGFGADIGVGWSFLQTERVRLSLEALCGGTLFWFKTNQGFSNDMFKPDAYIKVHLEVLIGKGK